MPAWLAVSPAVKGSHWRRALAALLLPFAGTAVADARLAGIFGDHMVLQRNAPIAVWGWAAPGEAVRVQFRGQSRRALAAADGRWAVRLAAAPAGGPHVLTVQGSNRVVLRDVLVGDLWLCSGQSNMEWALQDTQDAAQAIASADLPKIRHVKIAHRASLQPQDDGPPNTWQVSSPTSAGSFSAVGFHFARRLHQALGVPIGLVNASWGGTHLETWLSPHAALADPDLAPHLNAMPTVQSDYAAWSRERAWAGVQRWQPGLVPQAAGTALWSGQHVDDSAWRELQVPGSWEDQGLPGFDGELWLRRQVLLSDAQAAGAATLQLGAIDDCDETWVNGQRVGGLCGWDTPRRYSIPPGVLHGGANAIAVRVTDTGGGGGPHGDAAAVQLQTTAGNVPLAGRWKARPAAPMARHEPQANDLPTLAFNGMLQPLQPLRLRGVLWYQGESNVPRAARYAAAQRRLITDWRAHWGQATLPFYQVQLASFLPLARNTLDGSPWAELRDAQRQVLDVPHTGMAVAIDVGDADDIHPRNKQAVGDRLARLALRDLFGRPVVAQGPVLRGAQRQGGQMVLQFDHAAGGLALRSGGGISLQGFAVAGIDQRFRPAEARIAGTRVIVGHAEVPAPVAVRYGWVDNAGQANLVNRAGLPASPFRTDDWRLVTEGGRFSP